MFRISAGLIAGAVALGIVVAAAATPLESGRAAKPLQTVFHELRKAGVPLVLSLDDAARYRRIFALQDRGNWQRADAEIDRLENRILLGYVRFQKLMHPTEYRSSFDDLAGWLEQYAEQPGARRIHRLALRRQEPDDERPRSPVTMGILGGHGPDWPSMALHIGETPSQRKFVREILQLVSTGQHDAALARLHDGSIDLELADIAQLEGRIAVAYYAAGDFWRAFTLAAAASTSVEPGFSWIHLRAGLAALQLDLTYSALEHFGHSAITPGNSWETASGAYWAAQIYASKDNDADAVAMLRLAAEHSRTLYGQLAMQRLGLEESIDWTDRQYVTFAPDSPVFALPAARRAIALVQAGRIYEADGEFRRLAGGENPASDTELLALTQALDLPDVQIRIGSRLARSGPSNLSALYPASGWVGRASTKIDQALVHAIVRKESGFYIRAKSSRGARGLMQVLPVIARNITDDKRLRGPGADHLYEPVYNLLLGQRILADALSHPSVDGNLIGALVAYNAGLSNWLNWSGSFETKDPLLFIESIPLLETRWFVKRVLASLWMYRDRFMQEKPSREDLSRGHWPQYVRQDSDAADPDSSFYVGS